MIFCFGDLDRTDTAIGAQFENGRIDTQVLAISASCFFFFFAVNKTQ